METEDRTTNRDTIREKLRENFQGKIVRKDLTKKIKEGANVPVYVLEFLLGQYCSSDDEEVIRQGVENVKQILANNYVRPDEAQKILSLLRQHGSHTIIDMVSVELNIKKDRYEASFTNMGLTGIPIGEEYPTKYDRLLCSGIWCIVQLEYESDEDTDIEGYGEFNEKGVKYKKKKDFSPIRIRSLTPVQMPHIDLEELEQGRKAFTKDEWIDVLLRSSGMEPDAFTYREKWLLLDRIHCYNPGWEIPKFRPEHFTDDYGFITDYMAEFMRELRKENYGDALDQYFHLGRNLNQRDTIAVRKMVDGYIKLLYPDGSFTKDDVAECLTMALEMRRRVKEQLKKLGGMEFYDVNFSYIDNETFEEHYVSVPEQGGGKLIPEGMCNPGQIYTVSRGKNGMIGVFRLESQMLPGNGKFDRTGIGSDRECKEATDTAYNYLKANGNRISGSISTTSKDYIINYQDLQGIGMTHKLALPTLIALCSIALSKPAQSSLVVLGEISISGTLMKVDELANALQVCLDSGAKKILLPITSAADLGTVPPELMGSFQIIFYSSAEDAVFKALGVE